VCREAVHPQLCRLHGSINQPPRATVSSGHEAGFPRRSRGRADPGRLPGRGNCYRTVAPLQRAYFDPPTSERAGWDISQETRPSKLRAGPALEHGGDQRHVRYRKTIG
jgi:hypothetical protein